MKKMVDRLSIIQRKILIRHIDTVLPYIAGKSAATRVLLERKLLKPASNSFTLRATRLTDRGREAACMILAEYAELLIASGYGVSPLECLARMKNLSYGEPAKVDTSQQLSEIIIPVE
jgi:hypothetical protein